MKIENIIGKPVYFIDKQGAWRISKAISVHGNNITVQDAIGGKERIHPETSKIFGVAKKTVNSTLEFEPIEFKQIRKGKKLKNKIIKKKINAMAVRSKGAGGAGRSKGAGGRGSKNALASLDENIYSDSFENGDGAVWHFSLAPPCRSMAHTQHGSLRY